MPVIDTDRIAHELVEPGQPALQQILQEFGAEYINAGGRLDRRKMRQAIFTNDGLKTQLESILHPLIAREALRRVGAVVYPYCLVVVPLYVESARWRWVDRIAVVDVCESAQITRVMKRDGISRKQAEAALAIQARRDERLAIADDVIDNSGALENLEPQVSKLHRQYLALARRRAIP